MRSRRRTHHSHVAWSGSDEEFQSQSPRPAWDAAWDGVRAEHKQVGLPNAYERIGFVLALFDHRQLPASGFTDCWPLSSTLHASRSTPPAPPSSGTSGGGSYADPPPLATAWYQPSNCQKTTGTRSRRAAPPLSVCHRTDKSIGQIRPFSSPAAAEPFTILLWPEALNASGSRRACRMATRRNACSLLAFPDFPEFAQAVRYGVPGSPRPNDVSTLNDNGLCRSSRPVACRDCASPEDPDLAAVVAAWPELPEAIRAAILAMVKDLQQQTDKSRCLSV